MKIQSSVNDILINEWDPIGIKNNPNAKAEYDQYGLKIVGMLYNGSTAAQIAEYLNTVTREEFELVENDELSRAVTKKIISLKIDRPYRK
jgi:hypothetical protein